MLSVFCAEILLISFDAAISFSFRYVWLLGNDAVSVSIVIGYTAGYSVNKRARNAKLYCALNCLFSHGTPQQLFVC